jgi:peptidoglycan/LPS O-acetylase OafA/YrhL
LVRFGAVWCGSGANAGPGKAPGREVNYGRHAKGWNTGTKFRRVKRLSASLRRGDSAGAAPANDDRVTRHRADIQGLRAVAVLLVALGHAGVPFLKGGYVGVDVFFVLSGFLITGLLISGARARRYVSLAEFYARRARRILPAAALTLIVTDLAAYHLLNVVRAKQALLDSIPSALFFANVHFAAQGTDYFAQGQPPSPFQQFWSLSVEEQFYVVWPTLFIIFLGLSFRRHGRRPERIGKRAVRRMLVVVAVIAFTSLAWSIHYTGMSPTGAYFSTLARAWELALGAGLALGASRLAGLPAGWRTWMAWAGLACIVIAALTFSASTPFPGYAALLPTLGAALLIAAGIAPVASSRSPIRILGTAPLRYVGDRSYAFYLWHWPILVIAAQRAGHNLSVGTNLALLAAAFALSIVSYRLIEKPIRYMQMKRRAEWAMAAAGSVLAVVILATFYISSIDHREVRQRLAADALPPPVLAVGANSAVAKAEPQSTSAAGETLGAQALPAVVREVNLDSHHRAMPAVLIPPAAELLSDLPQGIPSGCIADTGQTQEQICHLGASSSSRTIVVLGDSHAQEWLPDVLNLAQRDNWAVVPLIKEGCSPNQWIASNSAPYCPRWFRWAMGEASALRADVALIAGAYSEFGPTLNPATLPGLASAVRVLKRRSRRVVIIGDVPARHQQPVDCVLAPHATPAGCSELLTPGEAEETDQVAQFADADHVGFIDTTGWFCYQQQCPLVIGDVITYRDNNHVSTTYAGALRRVFRAAFYAAVGHRAES